jgi:hypothetical protein
MDFQSIYPANSGFIRLLWESYIERNLARTHFYKGDYLEAKRLNELVQQKRMRVSAQLSAADVPVMAHHFNLEFGLAKFDDALNSGAGEPELTAIFEDYVEPNVPRGVDRVWDRLHAALNKEAENRGYSQLLSRLSQINVRS